VVLETKATPDLKYLNEVLNLLGFVLDIETVILALKKSELTISARDTRSSAIVESSDFHILG